MGSLGQRVHEVWRASPRLKAIRLLTRSSRPLAVCLALDVVFQAVFPILVLLALGSMVSAIPGAITGGWSSPAGDRLVTSLLLVGLAFFPAMLTTPFHDWL